MNTLKAAAYPFRPARTSLGTATSFTAKIPTATKPSGSGVIDIFDCKWGIATETYMPKFMQLVPYGTDANNEQFYMRVIGWSPTDVKYMSDGTPPAGNPIWIPQLLLAVTVTHGNIGATAIGASHFLADTIDFLDGDTDASIINPADDLPASAILHLRGCHLIEFVFSLDAALTEGAGANCLWRPFDQS